MDISYLYGCKGVVWFLIGFGDNRHFDVASGPHTVLIFFQAHMIYSEHDANFYALDKQVRCRACMFF